MRLRPRSRGMALILVVVIVALLAAIALPFAYSMGQQQKGAAGVVDRVHARFAVTAARNRAVAAVVPGWEGLEELPTSHVPFHTPFFDTAAEFTAGRAGRPMAPGFGTGALVADEQGKINVRSAPKRVVDNLMKRIDPRVDEVKDYLTESNGRPADWIGPQTLRWVETYKKKLGLVLFSVDRWDLLGPGTRVRVTNWKTSRIGEVVEVEDNLYALEGVSDVAEVDALIEVELRHALNLNTASREALAASFEGLAFRGSLDKDRVTREEADRLAAAMVKRSFETWRDVVLFLWERAMERDISEGDASVIWSNMKCPTSPALGGTGTVPATLQSWNYVTVAARGVMERPNRAVGGECDVREIVEAAPPGLLAWRWRSQQDFRDPMDRLMARGIYTGPLFPNEEASRDRSKGAWFTGVTGEDFRGAWSVAMHFGPANEGKQAGEGLTFGGLPAFAQGQTVCWPAGAMELWFQAPDHGATIFEAGEEEWSNRVALTYESAAGGGGGILRLVVKDATLERGLSQVVASVSLVPKRWYHVGGFWKGTRNGGMTMTLDGLPVGEWRFVPEGLAQSPSENRGDPVRLAGGLASADTSVACDGDLRGWPASGAIAIGQEVIEYGMIEGQSFKGCRRGARGTQAWGHPSGATVAPWGYTDVIVGGTVDYAPAGFLVPALRWDRLPRTSGCLESGFGTRADTTTHVKTANPTTPPKVGLLQGELILGVPHGTTAGFPARGWLLISGLEIVHYDAKNDNAFTGLQRGLFGTPDTDHLEGASVVLQGFHVTTNAAYPDPTVVCIGREFFGPVQKVGGDGWLALVEVTPAGTVPWPLFRGSDWGPEALESAHPDGAAVTPTFPVEDRSAGPGDRVTIVQRDLIKREEATIACVAWLEDGATAVLPALRAAGTRMGDAFHLAALDRHAAWEVLSEPRRRSRRWSRLLKFPSGELPYVSPQPVRIGFSAVDGAPGELGGWIDELRCTTAEYDRCGLATAIDSSSTDLSFGVAINRDPFAELPAGTSPGSVPPPGWPLPPMGKPPVPPVDDPIVTTGLDLHGGAVLVDDEVIGYVEYDPATLRLKGLSRGWLGTTPRAHAKGSLVYPLTPLAVAVLGREVDSTARAFESADLSGFPQEGYFLVDRELVGWSRHATFSLWSPAGCNFRGAFGTRAEPHSRDALLYAMPFRFFDRYTRASDDSDLHWLEASLRATSARWTSISWEELFGGASVDVKAFVRFSTSPRWIHMPTPAGKTKKDPVPHFYEFENPGGGSLGPTMADQVDIRFMFEYLDGAYEKGEWKECPLVRGFEVKYEQDNVVHRHEER